MKTLNEVLEKENKDSMEMISKLKEKLQKQNHVNTVHVGSQTDDADLLFCEECEYPAETLYELGEHVGEFHSGHRIPCDFCDNIYLTKKELKDHEIKEHTANISRDVNTHSPYLSVDEGKESKDQRHNEMSSCKFCDKRFQNKKDLMKHNKEKHLETLSSCWNFEAGSCEFEDNCWFKHDKIEVDKENENLNNEDRLLLKRLVEMVEKLTKRVIEIETN